MFKLSSNYYTDTSEAVLLLRVLFVICVCLCYTVLSVSCSLVITCWERVYLLALLCVMCHVQTWCPGLDVVLDLSIPDISLLP